jgi:hypothetical protein
MGWHVPNLGSYVRNQFQYTAHLTLGLKIHDSVLVTPDDFRRQKCVINSQSHTKSCFEYTCIVPKYDQKLTARYFLVQEHALGCILTLSTTSTVQLPVICYLIHQHVRPVEPQSSMAQGAEILTRWANMLASAMKEEKLEHPMQVDYPADAAFWQSVANEFTVKTRLMRRDGWYRDYDSVTGEWSTQQDAMHLAPVFCGVTGWSQVEQLRPFLAQPLSHSHGWAPLSWPPVVMTLVGAAEAAQMPLNTAELAYRFNDVSYHRNDSRELDEHGGLPGVTREYRQAVTAGKWGAIDNINAGIKGYGWGALSIHLIMGYLMGLREEEADKITITPALPQALHRVGATYRIAPIPWGNNVLGIECIVRDSKGYTTRRRCESCPA